MTANEFNTTVVPMNPKLFRYAYRFLEDRDEAQDAVQEVFVKLWRMRDKMKEVNNIEAFAVRVTRNYCLDKIKTRHTVSLDVNDYFKDRISESSNPEEQLHQSDTMKELGRMMEELPEPQRSVIRMRDVEGYSNEEVGEILGLTPGNVRVVLSRARKKIRESFIQLYHGTESDTQFVAEIL
jgi:RNA polymerase sigma-70 factor (ECF subfamily)